MVTSQNAVVQIHKNAGKNPLHLLEAMAMVVGS